MKSYALGAYEALCWVRSLLRRHPHGKEVPEILAAIEEAIQAIGDSTAVEFAYKHGLRFEIQLEKEGRIKAGQQPAGRVQPAGNIAEGSPAP